jgi:hypothetical protein
MNADEAGGRKGCRMPEQIHLALRHLEGRRVNIVLNDGSRILDAQLISAGRPGISSMWVLVDGTDNFIPVLTVTEVLETTQAA